MSILGGNFAFAADEAMPATSPNAQHAIKTETTKAIAGGKDKGAIIMHLLCGAFANRLRNRLLIPYLMKRELNSDTMTYEDACNLLENKQCSSARIAATQGRDNACKLLKIAISAYYGYKDEKKRLTNNKKPLAKGPLRALGRCCLEEFVVKGFCLGIVLNMLHWETTHTMINNIHLALDAWQTLAQIYDKYPEDCWIEFGRNFA